MNVILYKGKLIDIPDHWNELSGKQLIAIMKILYGNKDVSKGRISLFKIISGFTWFKIFKMTGYFRFLHLDQWINAPLIPGPFKKYLDRTERFMHAVDSCTAFIMETADLTVNLLPVVKTFHGPNDDLANVKAAEFFCSEFYFTQWRETNQISFLNYLVATLYRPSKRNYDRKGNPDGDIRIAFNPNLTATYLPKIETWPPEIKQAIALFYQGAREKKIANNPRVFEKSDGEGTTLYGLWSVMRMISKGGHFGDFDKVQDLHVDTLLMELNEVIAEADRMEAEMDKIKHSHG
ncbi:hypothetical protein QEG73_21880 [Chitinophagaceae bacterium 26-R-25]|nr:hypothetical protein [Chitinophagaceae bacterium 26-R-25]